ncbi:MAG TPA: hypothetical protein VMR92_01700 [Gemmatimonadales bacterium]|nr:hypothetical protein [Gemmatimonadales bacterium]
MKHDDDFVPGLYFDLSDGRLTLRGLQLEPGETAHIWACARLSSFPLGPPENAAITTCARCNAAIVYHRGAYNGPTDAVKLCMECAVPK